MPKLKRSIWLTIIIVAAISGLLLTTVLVMSVRQEDRLAVLLICLAVMGSPPILLILLMKRRCAVPAGHVAIVGSSDRPKTVAGPAEVVYRPLFTKCDLQPLRQKPIDYVYDCDTRDHLTVRISLSVFWDAQVDSLVSITRKKLDVSEVFKRHVQARLNVLCYRYPAEEVPRTVNLIAERVADYLNDPARCERVYQVKEVLITQAKLPPEIMSAAARVKEAEFEAAIADSKRASQAHNHTSEATARAVGLAILEQASHMVGDRAVEMERNRDTAPKPKPEV
jgi:regulator of protease activity HflC (stomatin/prohibitin superfamily)